MGTTTITQLPPGTSLNGTELFESVQDGQSVRLTAAQIAQYAAPSSPIPVSGGGTGSASLTGYVKGAGITPLQGVATIPLADISGAGTAASKDLAIGTAAPSSPDVNDLWVDTSSTASYNPAAGYPVFASPSALLSDSVLSYAPTGDQLLVQAGMPIITSDLFAYTVAASGASDHHVTTAGGVKLYYLTGGLRTESGRRFQVVSGVIRNRNDGNGWQIIEDASHDHVGVASIGTNTTGVTVAFNFTAAKVVSFVAGPDERMAQAGMTVGGSVGVTSAGLWIGAPLQFWFDPVTATINAPAWFDPAGFSVTGSGATRTITHPEISSANAPPVLGTGFVSSLNCPDYGVSSFTTTGFGLQSLVDLSGNVYFNGTSWVIQSDIDTSVHTITATWEATNGGQLRVTHPATDSDFEVALISTSSGHRAFVNACADTAFTVQFFDYATNTQLASPVSPVGVRFSRRRRCRAASLQSGRVTCVRSQARLDPTRLHDGTLPLANIWFVGVFEL